MSTSATTSVENTKLVKEITSKIIDPIFAHMLKERQIMYDYVKNRTVNLEAQIKELQTTVKMLDDKINKV